MYYETHIQPLIYCAAGKELRESAKRWKEILKERARKERRKAKKEEEKEARKKAGKKKKVVNSDGEEDEDDVAFVVSHISSLSADA